MTRYIGAYRGGVRPSAPTSVYRTCAVSFPCHSEPVTDVTGVAIRPRRARRRGTPKPPLCKGRWDCPKGRSAPRRGVLLPPAAKVPKNAVQTCGLKIPYAPSPAAYHVKSNHAIAVLCKFPLNLASSLLLFSLPLLLRNAGLCGSLVTFFRQGKKVTRRRQKERGEKKAPRGRQKGKNHGPPASPEGRFIR